MRRHFYGALLLAGALMVSGCDNELEDAPGPTDPAPTVTETFTGNVTVNGAQTHTFSVLASGTVTATITEITPDPATKIGLAIGTFNGSNCLDVITKGDAVQGNTLTGNVTGIGTLCVRIHDAAGTLTEAIGYTLTVVHP